MVKLLVESLGKRLVDLRQGKPMTQDALAKASGVRQTTISAIERDKQNPRESTLRLLAIGLQVEFEDFRLYLEGKKNLEIRRRFGQHVPPETAWFHNNPALFGRAVEILTQLDEVDVKEFVDGHEGVQEPSHNGDSEAGHRASPGRRSNGPKRAG